MIRALCIAVLMLAAAGVPAHAHKQNTALTDIRFNDRAETVEIAHRFSLHDAEHVLSEAIGVRADLSFDTDAQAAFAIYVAERFSVSARGGVVFAPTLLGSEIEGGYIWVYQEMPQTDGVDWIIQNDALRDLNADQVNLVNVRFDGELKTLTFGPNTGPQSIRIPARDSGPEAP